jgi:hypothetical protein
VTQLTPRRKAVPPKRIGQLREELAQVSTASEAYTVADRALYAKRVYEAIGHSVAECNQYAEIYMSAYWKFGRFVQDIGPGRQKTPIDGGLPGTEHQRNYARRWTATAKESDIPEYVRVATEQLESASIAGCLEWLDPGRHGNLKGEYEWYTPAAILDAARVVMGGIDLDPASCLEANAVVQATHIFTEADNGLEQPWHGRVFLNPPFAHPTVKYFAEKLLESLETCTVDQAVWLSNACVDTEWWQALAGHGLVCCHRGRIKFYGPDGEQQPPTLGQTIIYLGPARDAFRAQFELFGVVLS